jgi:hypothetical protein
MAEGVIWFWILLPDLIIFVIRWFHNTESLGYYVVLCATDLIRLFYTLNYSI